MEHQKETDTSLLQLIQIVKSNENFSRAMFKVLEKNEGNIVFSPLSAQLVLTLAQLGAKNQTAREMSEALFLPADREALKLGINGLLISLEKSNAPGITVKIANKMYIKNSFKVHDEFLKEAIDTFNTGIESVDFLDSLNTAELINTWVEEVTNNTIRNIVSAKDFSPLTRMVLINAVYFHGFWKRRFLTICTRPSSFYTDEENFIEVPFMNKEEYIFHAKIRELDAQLVVLPYVGDEFYFVVLLPDSRTGLFELEKKMQNINLSDLLKPIRKRYIILSIPKFKVEADINLNEHLKQMGMRCMFEEEADFSGINTAEVITDKLRISAVVQKAYIKVDELGTEAAAVTKVVMLGGGLPPEIEEIFVVDHPALFYLIKSGYVHDGERSVISLFSGRLLKPTM